MLKVVKIHGHICLKVAIKLKLKPAMASMSYLQKLILVSARQNLRPSATTTQRHLETRHTKVIPNFLNLFEVFKIKIGNLILNGPFLKNLLDQNRAILAS